MSLEVPSVNNEQLVEETDTTKITLKQACTSYLDDRLMLTELIVCIAFAFICAFVPHVFDVRENDIPYQILSSGDVVLDLSLNNDYIEEQTVPTIVNYVISVGGVLFVLIGVSLYSVSGNLQETHASVCAFCTAFGLTQLMTSCLKLYVGRFRPNFYQKCNFDSASLECESESDSIQARKSFPSGHSSLAFVSMTLLTLFFLGKSWGYRSDQRGYGYQSIRRLLSMISLLPMGFAIFVAASRIVDEWHHPSDVIAGSLIGAASANFAYNIWFNPWGSIMSGIPRMVEYDKSLSRSGSML